MQEMYSDGFEGSCAHFQTVKKLHILLILGSCEVKKYGLEAALCLDRPLKLVSS